jgi:hypothetical protein
MKNLNNIQMSTMAEQDLNNVNGGASTLPILPSTWAIKIAIKIIQWFF